MEKRGKEEIFTVHGGRNINLEGGGVARTIYTPTGLLYVYVRDEK